MNNELYELEIIKPNWYAKDFDNIEDYTRSTRIKFGVVMGNPEDIVDLFLSFNDNKQEIFDDYKEFKENLTNNRMKSNLKEIDTEIFCNNEIEYVNQINDKYKVSIEKLMELFFKEPLMNQYEYNLIRNIPQNFVELNTVWHSIGNKLNPTNIETKHLVYEENDFEFTDKCIRIVPYNLNFIDLTKIREISNGIER